MRLTENEAATIRNSAQTYFGRQARVWLFGSRADDSKRGGDIDLYIESETRDAAELVDAKLCFLAHLHRDLGEQKIDVVLQRGGNDLSLPIYKIAREEGIRLL